MRLKPGARIRHCNPEILWAGNVAAWVYDKAGQELVITSGTDGSHSRSSRHYQGDALDLRTWYFDPEKRLWVRDAIAERVGPDFDVVLESNHIHMEYDPKTP